MNRSMQAVRRSQDSAPGQRPLPQVSEREREFWRRAVWLERQRLEDGACMALAGDGLNLH